MPFTEAQLQTARHNLVSMIGKIKDEEHQIEQRLQDLTHMGVSLTIALGSVEDDLLDIGAIPEECTEKEH